MLTTAQKRTTVLSANRGASLLDMYKPGWHKKIDTKSLDLGDTGTCILGQAFGDFFDGIKEIANIAVQKTLSASGLKFSEDCQLTLGDMSESLELDAAHYGFNTPNGLVDDESQMFSLLGETWLGLIADRKATDRRRAAARRGAKTRAAKGRSAKRR